MISLFLCFVKTFAQILLTKFAWGHAGFALESTAEITFVGKSASINDLLDALFALRKESFSRGKPTAYEIIYRRITRDTLENVGKMRGTYVKLRRKRIDRDFG